MRKKGQAASDVSILIILIGVFLILYVILLPPGERDKLLGEEWEETVNGIPTDAEIILSASPGKVYPYITNIQNINLEPMQLYQRIDSKTVELAKSIIISRSLFRDGSRTIYFNVESKDKIKDVGLLTLVTKSEGILSIKINDYLIYEGFLTAPELPLRIPPEYLVNGRNSLELKVSRPITKFYATNQYVLQDLKIIKHTERTNLQTTRTFHIDELGQGARKAILSYYLYCNDPFSEYGTLTINLNNKRILSDEIYCAHPDLRERTIDPRDLKTGINQLDFNLDVGDININNIELDLELQRSTYPSYVFDIDANTFNQIRDNKKRIILRLTFEEQDRKISDLIIQNKKFQFDTFASSYEYDITSLIERGSNTIKLEPRTEFEIINLRISAEKA